MKELEYTTQSVPKDRRFCTICGKVKRLHYFEGDSTHCSACCEKMLHTRLNGWSIPVALGILALAAVSIILCVHTVPYCAGLFRADAARRDKRLADANALYASAISDSSEHNTAILSFGKKSADGSNPTPNGVFFEAGSRTWTHYLETYAALYSEYEAASLVENSLDAQTAARIPAVAQLNEAKQAYDDTLAFMEKINEESAFDSPADMPYDGIMAKLTAYADESDSRYVKGYIEYYKGMATRYYKQDDPAASAAYFEKMLEYLPDEFMTAYTAEANAAFAAGAYETAIEAYEKILEKNKNYTSAYPAIAEAAFFAGNEEKLASALAHYDEDDPLRLQLEMRFALRSDDLDKAAAVRKKAQQTIKLQADQIFNGMLAEQTISQQNKELLMSYVDFALEDAAYALVQGDTEEAFRIAYDEAFNYTYYYAYLTSDSSAFTQPIINMATLCASLLQDKDALQTIQEVGICDDATQQAIDDGLTAREIFVEGKAEIL